LRVLSIAHPAGSNADGAQRYRPLADDPEFELHLLIPNRWREFGRRIIPRPKVATGIVLHLGPVRWLQAPYVSWYLHHYPKLRRVLQETRPDVIHLWEEAWSFVALQAVVLRKRHLPNAAIVLEVDQNILKRLPFPFQQIRRYVFSQTDHLLVRSPEALQVARDCGFWGTASPIHYGVDQVTFRPGNRAAARGELNLNGFVIGYVGRLVEEKGIDDVLTAMALTPATITLVIVGEGPHKRALQEHALRLGLAAHVHFLPRSSPSQVARILQALDILVLLTRTTPHVREQFGRVIIEAQACGVPVIGSSCGAIPFVVGTGGWIVPERAPQELANLLGRLAMSPDEIGAAGVRGGAQVGLHFTYAHVARALAMGWRDAVATRRSAEYKRADSR
jgi:glycosyltransferase involved in cell wall biosynthesis